MNRPRAVHQSMARDSARENPSERFSIERPPLVQRLRGRRDLKRRRSRMNVRGHPVVTLLRGARLSGLSMTSDVAFQGGGAGPGRDRHWRARSAVRAGWRGGPSPGTANGHSGEARRNVAKGRGNSGPRLEKRGSSEDLLAISRADFRLICGSAGAVTGIIRWGGAS
jgi:hypothetical protein